MVTDNEIADAIDHHGAALIGMTRSASTDHCEADILCAGEQLKIAMSGRELRMNSKPAHLRALVESRIQQAGRRAEKFSKLGVSEAEIAAAFGAAGATAVLIQEPIDDAALVRADINGVGRDFRLARENLSSLAPHEVFDFIRAACGAE